MNKYQKWYNCLIEKAQARNWSKKSAEQYVESHHIVPKSLGGTDDESNLVFLTAREHLVAHLMLCKFGDLNQKTKMLYAIERFVHCNKQKINSHLYSKLKSQISDNRKRDMKNNKHLVGHKHSEETKLKMSLKRAGVSKSDNMKMLVSERMKITLNNKPAITCPHCSVISINYSNMTRWHFNNCRNK